VARDTPNGTPSRSSNDVVLRRTAGFALTAGSVIALVVAGWFVFIAVTGSHGSDLWFLAGYLLLFGIVVVADLMAGFRARRSSAVPMRPTIALNSTTSWAVRLTAFPFVLLAALMMDRTDFAPPVLVIGIALLAWSSFDVSKFVSDSARHKAYLIRADAGRK
jgi:hypothetical protein